MDWDPALFVFAYHRVLAERAHAREQARGADRCDAQLMARGNTHATSSAPPPSALERAWARWMVRPRKRASARASGAPLAPVIPLHPRPRTAS